MSIGMVHELSGRTGMALAAYEATLRINPNAPRARESIARLRTGGG